jgi:biopolymer transport protein ExbB
MGGRRARGGGLRVCAGVALACCLASRTAAAAQFEWSWSTLSDEWEKGGTTMWFLLALSIAAVAFGLERAIRLRRGRIVPAGLRAEATALWTEKKLPEIQALCDRDGSVLAGVVAAVVRARRRPVPEVSAEAGEAAVRLLRPHNRRIYPLLVIATLSPLMGLFGTVVGLMEAFENFRLLGETGDPSVFAGSISKALITTIVGLAIAMPTLAVYHYFKSRTNALSDLLEAEVSGLIDEWLRPEEVTDARQA